MAGMFPTFVADPNDRNRRYHSTAGPTWPGSLRAAYYVALVAAVLLLLSSMLMLASGAPKDAGAEFAQAFATNMRIVAWTDILLGLIVAGCAAFFERGSKGARRLFAAAVAIAVFVNLAGFFVGVAGWSAFAVTLLLVAALFFAFRPAANAFVDARSGDLWRNVEGQ